MSERFVIGQTVQLQDIPASKIVGIDRYTLFSHAGKSKSWVSYTLESSEEGSYQRFWITDEPSGFFCWTALDSLPENPGNLDFTESGICVLDIEGDSLIDSPYSSVLFYVAQDRFYCSEVFNGSKDVFYMQGREISSSL